MAALRAIADAAILIGAKRLIDEFGDGKNVVEYISIKETLQAIRDNTGKNVAVLVTGDPGFFSITALIIREFGYDSVKIIPGISSITYAFSRLGLSWHDAVFLSAHKEMPDNFEKIANVSRKIGILTSPRHNVLRCAMAIGVSTTMHFRFFVGVRLSYPDELLKECTIEQMRTIDTGDLSVLIAIRKEDK
jgi:precorrin-6y C5,15-methyltransferase (decarboxylating) CbiE subunit